MSVAQLPLALKSPRQPGFENFVAGRSRPVVATLSLGLEPGGWYLVCGPRGSGRSHLLGAALADRIRNGEQAIFIGLKKTGQLDLLEQADGDWVIVDDIDARAGSAAAELALFNALNRFRAARCGVIMSAAGLDDFQLPDLRSRLGQAVRLTVKPLDEAGLLQLATLLVREYEVVTGRGAIDYLISRAPRNAAHIAALIEAGARRALVEKRSFSIPLVRELLESSTWSAR